MKESKELTKDQMIPAALCLEGGSLRGLFTAGVLDVLMENNIYTSYVNGVSAGSMCGMSYVSRQPGRTKHVNIDYLHDRRYISLKNLMTHRQIFNFEFLFGRLSSEYLPFDWKTFFASPQKFETVATRCRTGQAEYFDKDTCPTIVAALEASASMPLLSRMITVEGKKYLDGGVSVPIAYERAFDLGYCKVIAVLTREEDYRKEPISKWMVKGYERYFKPLPEFLVAVKTRPERYNNMLSDLKKMETEGKIFIIRPQKPVQVKRVEQDPEKLEALYREGRRVTEEMLPAIRQYLEIR